MEHQCCNVLSQILAAMYRLVKSIKHCFNHAITLQMTIFHTSWPRLLWFALWVQFRVGKSIHDYFIRAVPIVEKVAIYLGNNGLPDMGDEYCSKPEPGV